MRFTRFIPFAAGTTLFMGGILYFAVPNELRLTDLPSALNKSPFFHSECPPIPHNDTQQQPDPQRIEESHPEDPETLKWRERAESVKAAFKHAYTGYMKYAKGYDELLPVSKSRTNK